MTQKSAVKLAFILVTSLFFLWAFLHNINPILIPHLKKACQLSDARSALIDSAVYMGYFLAAIPAGLYMQKHGYKKGIIFGLILYAVGALMFIPAASSLSFVSFLTALFVMACGATFLETVANPYITKLGSPETATQRLNFAQSFNGVGAFIAPIIGGMFILSGVEHSPEELNAFSPDQLNTYLAAEASTVKVPYILIGLIVLALAVVFMFVSIPEFKSDDAGHAQSFSLKLLKNKNVLMAVLSQFVYVGGQVCVGSFFIRFARYTGDIGEKNAAYLWGSIAMVGFMVGRFIGTWLMGKIKPARLLMIYGFISTLLMIGTVFLDGSIAVYALMATPFFMSIMFPTIFSLGLEGLEEKDSQIASALLVMAIVGGAIFPVIQGYLSDANGGNIQISYLVPVVCFALITWYGWFKSSSKA